MGNVMELTPAGISNTRGLPHSREDLIVLPLPQIVETILDEEIAAVLAESESRSMENLFGGQLQDHRLVMSGADCPSLGAIRVSRSTIWFFEKVWDDERKLRCRFQDASGQLFNLPVSSVALRDQWHEGDVAALNGIFRGGGDAHVRIGLAHPMDDGRSFAMINGMAKY
jgi:hypothetical protein